MKDKIMTYLSEQYKKTKWPFVTSVSLSTELGCFPRQELNELGKEGLIARRESINGVLIELLSYDGTQG